MEGGPPPESAVRGFQQAGPKMQVRSRHHTRLRSHLRVGAGHAPLPPARVPALQAQRGEGRGLGPGCGLQTKESPPPPRPDPLLPLQLPRPLLCSP